MPSDVFLMFFGGAWYLSMIILFINSKLFFILIYKSFIVNNNLAHLYLLFI